MNETEIKAAVNALCQSKTGQRAAKLLLTFLERDGGSLDNHNKAHVEKLIWEFWYGSHSGTVLDVMRDATK